MVDIDSIYINIYNIYNIYIYIESILSYILLSCFDLGYAAMPYRCVSKDCEVTLLGGSDVNDGRLVEDMNDVFYVFVVPQGPKRR